MRQPDLQHPNYHQCLIQNNYLCALTCLNLTKNKFDAVFFIFFKICFVFSLCFIGRQYCFEFETDNSRIISTIFKIPPFGGIFLEIIKIILQC